MLFEKTHFWLDTVQAFTECLLRLPTISPDVEGENACAQAIARLLSDETDLTPYLWPTGDGRHSVACLLTGTHPVNPGRTVILMGHYDTVGVAEFAGLPGGAGDTLPFDPDRLHAVFSQLLADNAWQLHPTVRDDLTECLPDGQPAWLFGRGVLDMKSGVAAAIAVMRRLWAAREALAGNVLLLVCPDEEHESLGIRSALTCLLKLREAHGLHYVGVINTDYVADDGAVALGQDAGRYIYTGTVGKLLPSFYIVGVPTHVGEPFRGLDANQIAAALVQQINLNPAFADQWRADDAEIVNLLPPVTLRMRDLKNAYSAQTVHEALVCVNWLTCTHAPQTVLAQAVEAARAALSAALQQRSAHYRALTGQPDAVLSPAYEDAQVLTFTALCARVRAMKGWPATGDADDPLVALIDAVAADAEHLTADAARLAYQLDYQPDLPERSRMIVQRLAREAGIQGPTIIVFFAPPYYPHLPPVDGPLLQVVAEQVRRLRPAVRLRPFYPYISDLSYVSLDAAVEAGLPALIDNMPMFGRGYHLDFEVMRALGCPVVNIGPWGRDAHGLYERVYKPYAFEVIPQVIYDVARELLCHDA